MSIKTDQAIAKITKECEGKDHLIPFEEYLTSICTSDHVADKLMNEGKSLQGCLNHMREIAKNRAVSGCACIPPEEGFEIIREYYEIGEETKNNVIDITDLL